MKQIPHFSRIKLFGVIQNKFLKCTLALGQVNLRSDVEKVCINILLKNKIMMFQAL